MFHESYGEIEKATLSVIRKYNVSPSDYDELVGIYGLDENDIRNAIVEFSPKGYYNGFLMMRDSLLV